MNEIDKTRLRVNRRDIVENIQTEEICHHLIAEFILNEDDDERIRAKTTSRDKAAALLNMLPKKGPSAYKVFRDSLLQDPVYEWIIKKLDAIEIKTDGASQLTGETHVYEDLLIGKTREFLDQYQIKTNGKSQLTEETNIYEDMIGAMREFLDQNQIKTNGNSQLTEETNVYEDMIGEMREFLDQNLLPDMQQSAACGGVSSPRCAISPGVRALPPIPVPNNAHNRPPAPVHGPTRLLDEPISAPIDSFEDDIYAELEDPDDIYADPVDEGNKADLRSQRPGIRDPVYVNLLTASASPSEIDAVVPRTEDAFNLNAKQLKLKEQLGKGHFCTVVKGEYHRNGQNIPVAIKTLKKAEDGQSMAAEEKLMEKAKLMADLKNAYIIRLIGVCDLSDTLMLVLELAPLGRLNEYLKGHKDTERKDVIRIMRQVAEGMRYLESVKIVHRDLALRNVLLVTDSPLHAKISDFGLPMAIGVDSIYYKAAAARKWPLEWYAPECIYDLKFDSKSDVWSFGVTLWEAMSYGAKPYMGLKGTEIVQMLEGGDRLEKPKDCPQSVYEVMLRCWQYDKKDRPSFVEVLRLMSNL